MIKKIPILILLLLNFFNTSVLASTIKEIKILGNERISEKTIILFSEAKVNDEIDQSTLNDILKNLYKTNYFDNVSVKFEKNLLIINVKELPIIDNITIEGLKAKKYLKAIRKNFKLKPRNSFNEFLLSEEVSSIKSLLKDFGFYFAEVVPYIEKLNNNMVNINYLIEPGNKAKITKISFIGSKIYKDKKLRNVILSEESKFWKFISDKKFLNEEIIEIDKRLLKNFYLNKGYYNVDINTSFAKLINKDEFELIYNISSNEKIYFNNLQIIFPDDFDKTNYKELLNLLDNLKGKPYSIYSVEKILDEIDLITLIDEFESIKATLNEKIVSNKLNIDFIINKTEKYVLERVNIFGNNVTKENVIRNYLAIDEGDYYNEILVKKSENNLKNLNFFRKVNTEVINGKEQNSKIVNISVEEKPTGEISAGAGVGTSGGTIAVGIRENNYLGKGISLDANATLTPETFKGLLSFTNPKYNNTDKSVSFKIQAIEIDRLKKSGYKTNKTGFELGTDFEQFKDLNFGISTRSFYEKIETNSTASTRQKKQTGDYWDTFLKFNFTLDKRNQKFRTTDGFYSRYSLDLPVISENNTLTNTYDYKIYNELYENNISSMSLLLRGANSISGDDIKLTERLTVPSRRLRGFESGKVGPKDGDDFIGGNFVAAVNFNTTLPQLFPNLQNLDATFFLDAANIWGVDYDSSINDSSKIRSSFGIGVDWHTIAGPLNFSLSEVITKADSDVEESFRFNIGTTF